MNPLTIYITYLTCRKTGQIQTLFYLTHFCAFLDFAKANNVHYETARDVHPRVLETLRRF